jgi:hypothetical protein
MATSHLTRSKNLVALAATLERLERSPAAVDPDQFRDVVERLKAELAAAQPGAQLDEVLATFPCTAELYENINYGHAGLCRSDLDFALKGEMQARDAIAAARSGAKKA